MTPLNYLDRLASSWRGPQPKAAQRSIVNPVTHDAPASGQYAYYARAGDEYRARLAMQTSWSFSGMQSIAKAVTSSQLLIKRRAGEELEDIKNHPIEMLMRHPNSDMSREDVMHFTILSLYLKAAYWFLYPDSKGNIAELWPMPFTRVRPVPNLDPNPTSLYSSFIYTYQTGKEQPIPPDNVIYLKFPNPFDVYDSWPPLRAMMKPIITDNAQSDWNVNLIDKEKGMPAFIVAVPPEMDNDQMTQVRNDLKDNVGKRMVVRAGTINATSIQETHKEMQFLEGREFNEKEINKVLNVPDNLEDKEAYRFFINNTVWPVLQMIAGQITTQLTIPFYGPDILAEFEDIRPQDKSMAVQESVQYDPQRSFNQARAERSEPPLPKVVIPDHVEGFAGQSLYDDVPIQLVDTILPLVLKGKPEPTPPQLEGFQGVPSMAGSAGADHAQQQEEAQANPDQQTTQQETDAEQPTDATKAGNDVYIPAEFAKELYEALKTGKSIRGRTLLLRPEDVMSIEEVAGQRGIQPSTKAYIWQSWQDIAVKRLKAGKSPGHVYLRNDITDLDSFSIAAILGHCYTKASIKAVFDHIGDYISLKATIPLRGDSVPQEQLDLEDDFSPDMQEWLAGQAQRIGNRGGQEPDKDFWDNETKLLAAFLIGYVDAWTSTGISMTVVKLADVGLSLDAQINAAMMEWSHTHAFELANSLNATTKELARARLKQWAATGSRDTNALYESLREVIAPEWRARLIAQSEVTNGLRSVNTRLADELNATLPKNLIKGYTWETALDERVCPICGGLQGAKCPIGGAFPGGFSPNQGAHPGCRCGTSYYYSD